MGIFSDSLGILDEIYDAKLSTNEGSGEAVKHYNVSLGGMK